MKISLLHGPDLDNVIFNLLESLDTFEECVGLVGIVDVRVAFPLDVESLRDVSDSPSEESIHQAKKDRLARFS